MPHSSMEGPPWLTRPYSPRPPKLRSFSQNSRGVGYEGSLQGGRPNFDGNYQGAGLGSEQYSQQSAVQHMPDESQFIPGQRVRPSADQLRMIEKTGHAGSQEVMLRLNDIIKNGTPSVGGPRPEPMHYGRPGGTRSGYRSRPTGNTTAQVTDLPLAREEATPIDDNVRKPNMKKDEPIDESDKVLLDLRSLKVALDVRDLLNELTPANYGKSMQRMIEGQIPFCATVELLQVTVGLIFDKALQNPNCAELCSRMCRDLIKTEAKDANGEAVKFRTVMLQMTQRYFVKAENDQQEAEQEKNEEGTEALQEKRATTKRFYLSFIRFVSELYKVEQLTDRVILSCFQKLLPKKANFEDADEEKLECLCILLQTCAKMIKEQLTVNIIFEQLKKLIKSGVSSSRIRVLVENTIILRDRTYVPHEIVTAKPTTVEEVHAAKPKEEPKVRDAVADQGPVGLPRQAQILQRGGMAGRGGMMMPQSGRGMSKSSALSAMEGGSLMAAQNETRKKTLLGLRNSHDVGGAPTPGQQRAQLGAESGTGMHSTNASSPRPLENKISASSSRESSMNRLTNMRDSLTLTPTFPDEERSSRSPVEEDIELEADAVDEHAGGMLTRALNSDGEDSRDVIDESLRTIRRWTDPTKALFIKSILGGSFHAKSQERARCPEFLLALAREGLFPEKVLVNGLGHIVEDTGEIAMDMPGIYDYMVGLMGPLVMDGLLSPAALDGALSKSPSHVRKYHGALRKWLEVHLSPQQKQELINRDPVFWQTVLGNEK